jgi:phospholipase/carboxylesterase
MDMNAPVSGGGSPKDARTLVHKFLRPRRPVRGKSPGLILLHGRGADEDDLLGLAEYFDDRLFIISPRAPHPFSQGSGYTWYDLEEIGKPDRKMFSSSHARLKGFLAETGRMYDLDPAKTFCCGFSMGAIMALSIALTEPGCFAGVLANSGYVPEDAGMEFAWSGVKGVPFFIGHGVYDPVIPYAYGRRAKELLESHGAVVTHREYDMGHQINEESLGDMMAWLAPMLG